MSSHNKEISIPVIPVDKEKVKKIWKIAGLLALITAVEYLIAFIILPSNESIKYSRNIVFILLTIAKAFYIMKEFMHLGHESKSLQRSIIFPLIFLGWLILSQLMESSFIYKALQEFWGY